MHPRHAIDKAGQRSVSRRLSQQRVRLRHRGRDFAVDELPFLIERLDLIPLPISLQHALRAGSYRLRHRDPFDRLLVAQSQIEGLTLVTIDRALQAYGVETLW